MRRNADISESNTDASLPESTGEAESANNGRGGRQRRKLAPEERAVFRSIALLAMTVFIDLLGFGIVLPNLPQYVEATLPHLPLWLNHLLAILPHFPSSLVEKTRGEGALLGGLLGASYSFTQFLFAPAWGRYSDRAGRRPVILISLIGVAFSYTLFGLSNGHLWMLFAARLLAGFLSSASIGVAFAYVSDVTTTETRAMGIGLLGACFGLGFAFGPALGGILGHISLSLPAFVAAGMALVNFVLSWFLLPESLTQAVRERIAGAERLPYLAQMRQALADPAAPLFLVTFILTFGFVAIEQVFGYFLMARGIASMSTQQSRQSYLLLFVGVLGIILQGGLIGPFTKRFGEGNLIRTGLIILIIGYFLLIQPTTWGIAIFVAMAFVGVGRSMIGPAATSLISKKTNAGQGLIQSSSQGFDALARTVGPLTAGALFNTIGPTAPYIFSAVLTVVALTVTFLIPSAMVLPLRKQNDEADRVAAEKEPVSSTA